MTDDGWARERDDFDDDDDPTSIASSTPSVGTSDAQAARAALAAAARARQAQLQGAVQKAASLCSSNSAQRSVLAENLNKTAVFDALCALCAELDRASRDTIIACHSPKLDSAFFELLSARCGSMVLRELLGACACKVSHHEPRLQSPIHAALLQRVADARNNQDDRNVRICALHICGIMALQAGKSLASSLNDTLEACARQLNKSDEFEPRVAAVECFRRALSGAGKLRAVKIWSDILKFVKQAVTDDDSAVRIAGADLMCTVLSMSAQDFIELDTFIPFCLKAMSEPHDDLRLAFSRSLGLMLVECAFNQQTATSTDHVKRTYEVFDLRSAMLVLAGMFQKAPTAYTRGAIAFATLNTLRAAVTAKNLIADSFVPELVALVLAFLSGRAVSSDRDFVQSEKCVETLLRDALMGDASAGPCASAGCPMSERALELMMQQLLKSMVDRAANPSQVRCALRVLAPLLVRLGPASVESSKSRILDPLLSLLTHESPTVRILAAQVMRAFVRAAPAQAASMMLSLHAMLRGALSEAVETDVDSSPADCAPVLATVRGYGCALLALCSLSAELPCGVPNRVLEEVFDTGSALLSPDGIFYTGNPDLSPACVRRVLLLLGWQICAALLALGTPWIGNRLKLLFALWKEWLVRRPLLTPSSSHVPSATSKTCSPSEWIDEIALRAGALMALKSFALVFQDRLQSQPHLLRPTTLFAAHALNFAKQFDDLVSGSSSIVTAEAMDEGCWFKTLLFEVFTALPPSALSSRFVAIMHSAVFQFTNRACEPAAQLHSLLSGADRALAEPGAASAAWLMLQPAAVAATTAAHVAAHGVDATNALIKSKTASTYERDCLVLLSSDAVSNAGASGSTCARIEYLWTQPVASASQTASGLGYFDGHDSNSLVERMAALSPRGSNEADTHQQSTLGAVNGVARYVSPIAELDELGATFHCGATAHLNAIQLSMSAAVRLFGRIFADQATVHQKQLLDHFLAIVRKAASSPSAENEVRDSKADAEADIKRLGDTAAVRAAAVNHALLWNIIAALLCAVREMSQRQSRHSDVACKMGSSETLEVALSLITELMGWNHSMIRRASGECAGLMARLEDHSFTDRILGVLRVKFESKDSNVLCGAAFTAACLHRYIGAMRAADVLPFTMANLHNLAKRDDDPVRLWTLHALAIVSELGGPDLAGSYVKPTCAVAIVHACASHEVHLSPAIAAALCRLSSALVTTLGPDLASPTHADLRHRFISLCAHALASNDATCLSDAAELLEQLLLWCGANSEATDGDFTNVLTMNAVNLTTELSLPRVWGILSDTLRSRSAAARLAALQCIRHLAQKRPALVSALGLELELLCAVDRESSSSGTSDEAAATLAAVVEATASLHPLRWVHAAKLVLLGVGGSDSVAPQCVPRATSMGACAVHASALARFLNDKPDDVLQCRGAVDLASIAHQASSQVQPGSIEAEMAEAAALQAAVSSAQMKRYAQHAFRFSSRVLAADVLRLLLDSVRKSVPSQSPHLIPQQKSAARKQATQPALAGEGYLVTALYEILTVVCRAAEGAWVALKVSGLRALHALLLCFAGVRDASAPDRSLDDDGGQSEGGVLLLEQYQVQLSAVLKSAFAGDELSAHPQARAAACAVIVSMLSAGVGVSDSGTCKRLLDLARNPLCSPQHIQAEDQAWMNPIFATSARTVIRVSHLNALAQLQAVALGFSHTLPTPVGRTAAEIGDESVDDGLKLLHSTPAARFAGLAELMAPTSSAVVVLLMRALGDFAVLSSQPRRSTSAHTGNLFVGADSAAVKSLILSAAPQWLCALSAMLQSASTATETRTARAVALAKQMPWTLVIEQPNGTKAPAAPLPPHVAAAVPTALSGIMFLLNCIHCHMSGIVGGDLDRERRAVMNSLYDLETEFETPTGTRSPSGASSPVSFDNGDDSQIAQHRTLLAALGCLSQILRVSFVQVSSTSEAPLSMEDAQEAAAQVAALMYNESLSVDIQYAALDVLAQFVSLQNGEVPDSILLPMIEAASAPLRLCVRAVHPDFQSGEFPSGSRIPPALLTSSLRLLIRLLHSVHSTTDSNITARSPFVARILLHVVFLLRFASEQLANAALSQLPDLLRLLISGDAVPVASVTDMLSGCFASIVSHISNLIDSKSTDVHCFGALLRGAQIVAMLQPQSTAQFCADLAESNQQQSLPASVHLLALCLRSFSSAARAAACQTVCSLANVAHLLGIPDSDELRGKITTMISASAPFVAIAIRSPLDGADSCESLKTGVFILAFLGRLAPTNLESLMSLWLPLLLGRLFPSTQTESWHQSHELALQLLLKLAGTYGDAFRVTLNGPTIPTDLRSKLERAIEMMRAQQAQEAQAEKDRKAKLAHGKKKKLGFSAPDAVHSHQEAMASLSRSSRDQKHIKQLAGSGVISASSASFARALAVQLEIPQSSSAPYDINLITHSTTIGRNMPSVKTLLPPKPTARSISLLGKPLAELAAIVSYPSDVALSASASSTQLAQARQVETPQRYQPSEQSGSMNRALSMSALSTPIGSDTASTSTQSLHLTPATLQFLANRSSNRPQSVAKPAAPVPTLRESVTSRPPSSQPASQRPGTALSRPGTALSRPASSIALTRSASSASAVRLDSSASAATLNLSGFGLRSGTVDLNDDDLGVLENDDAFDDLDAATDSQLKSFLASRPPSALPTSISDNVSRSSSRPSSFLSGALRTHSAHAVAAALTSSVSVPSLHSISQTQTVEPSHIAMGNARPASGLLRATQKPIRHFISLNSQSSGVVGLPGSAPVGHGQSLAEVSLGVKGNDLRELSVSLGLTPVRWAGSIVEWPHATKRLHALLEKQHQANTKSAAQNIQTVESQNLSPLQIDTAPDLIRSSAVSAVEQSPPTDLSSSTFLTEYPVVDIPHAALLSPVQAPVDELTSALSAIDVAPSDSLVLDQPQSSDSTSVEPPMVSDDLAAEGATIESSTNVTETTVHEVSVEVDGVPRTEASNSELISPSQSDPLSVSDLVTVDPVPSTFNPLDEGLPVDSLIASNTPDISASVQPVVLTKPAAQASHSKKIATPIPLTHSRVKAISKIRPGIIFRRSLDPAPRPPVARMDRPSEIRVPLHAAPVTFPLEMSAVVTAAGPTLIKPVKAQVEAKPMSRSLSSASFISHSESTTRPGSHVVRKALAIVSDTSQVSQPALLGTSNVQLTDSERPKSFSRSLSNANITSGVLILEDDTVDIQPIVTSTQQPEGLVLSQQSPSRRRPMTASFAAGRSASLASLSDRLDTLPQAPIFYKNHSTVSMIDDLAVASKPVASSRPVPSRPATALSMLSRSQAAVSLSPKAFSVNPQKLRVAVAESFPLSYISAASPQSSPPPKSASSPSADRADLTSLLTMAPAATSPVARSSPPPPPAFNHEHRRPRTAQLKSTIAEQFRSTAEGDLSSAFSPDMSSVGVGIVPLNATPPRTSPTAESRPVKPASPSRSPPTVVVRQAPARVFFGVESQVPAPIAVNTAFQFFRPPPILPNPRIVR